MLYEVCILNLLNKFMITGKQMYILLIALLFISQVYGEEHTKIRYNLIEVIELGIKNNREIKAAQEKISLSKGRFWSGISLPAPEIGASYEYIPVNAGFRNYSESTFEVQQSFEFPINYFLRGSKYNKEIDAAFFELKRTEAVVISRIKSAYYNVLAKEEKVKLAEENLEITEDFSKKAEVRFNVGEAANLERLTAKVQFTEAKNNLEISQNEVNTAYAELNNALGFGKNSSEVISLKDSLIFQEYNLSLANLISLALSVNQQIKTAELNLSKSSIDKKLAWSSVLPGFNLSYFRQSRDGDRGFYGASFGISVPLWFMFEHRGNIQEAAANVNIAESELELTKNDIYLKIKSSFNEYQNSLKQVRLYLSDILPQADEIYRSARTSYDAGEITYIEFLQARQTLISARSNYINVLLNYNRSIFSLEETVGQSLTNEN